MPYIVVRRDGAVLSRTSPNALLTWERGTRAAVTFETSSGATKCAEMQGGSVVYQAAEGGCQVSGPSTARGVRRGLGHWVDDDGGTGLVC